MQPIKNILVITPWYPSPENWFHGTFVRDHAEAWKKYFPTFQDNVECNIVVLHLLSTLDLVNMIVREKRLQRLIRYDGDILVIHEQAWRLSHRLPLDIEKIITRRRMANGIQQALALLSSSPDLIIAQTISGLILAADIIAQGMVKAPVILVEHSNPLNMHFRNNKRKVEAKLALEKSSRIITVADRQSNDFSKYFGVKQTTRIFNPGHEDFFEEPIGEDVNSKDIFTLISVGRLVPEKGHSSLIKAMSKIPSYLIDKLILIGDGPEYGRIANLSKELGLSDKILLKGSLPREEIIKELKISDMFIFPSRLENCPVSLIEAQAMGLPCVCIKNNASERILLDGNGIAVSPDDNGDNIAYGIMDLMKKYAMYKREDIRDRARRCFSPFTFSKKCYRVFTEVISNKSSCGSNL